MLFVIEHLEPKLSEWLFIEYSHAARIAGRGKLLITNVRDKGEFRKISSITHVERRRARKLFRQHELIVLDPRARKKLSPADVRGKRVIIIGGILGEEPPLGRTKELLRMTMPRALARNLGRGQFSIDGATYMARQVSEGTPLDKVPVQHGLEIQLGEEHSVLLPYAYPLVNGRPLISRKLITYLKRPWLLGRR